MEPNAPKLILVPTDFSAPSAEALRYGAALAERFGAHLLVIYADPFLPPVDYTLAAGVFALPTDDMIEGAREQLQKFAEENVSTSVPYDVRVIVDGAVDAIFEQASQSGAQLIIMGTHGRTGLRRLLVGSVAEAVMRLASVPVIVVREGSKPGAAAMRRVVSLPPSTKEGSVATAYSYMLADSAEFLEVPAGADAAAVAAAGDADLIVLGVSVDQHDERIIRHVACPVLTVNRFAAARLTGVKVHERERAITA